MTSFVRFGICLVLSLALGGCGARGHVIRVEADKPEAPSPFDAEPAKASQPESLESFIARVKKKVASEKAPEQARAAQAESFDPRLAAAVAAASANPSRETYWAAASEYQRLGIADVALQYLTKAQALQPRDGATYDALARSWRDGGMLDHALADAYRAVYFAPRSAAAHNTLGTVFQALGSRKAARQEYERALALDPTAAYAFNNLCYAWILEREPRQAETACQKALAVDPTLRAARNNLALAYAAEGKMDAARAAFDATGDRAAAEFNFGIVQLARGRYSDAVTAFAAAQQIRPDWRKAAVLAKQARELAQKGAEE